MVRSTKTEFDGYPISPNLEREFIRDVTHLETRILRKHRFAITRKKIFSLLPEEAEVGDSIFVVKGDPDKAMFLVRKDAVLDQYRLIGHVYVHGIWRIMKPDDLEDIAITMY